ncbi:glycosyltransferase [Lactobacillus sp. PV034]|uniref:glycosyltransferase n=1 Tax=Lactobacillus sp. PV034 TaxID=2594495 RepID=UPI0022402DED|nr:glycosyltransferase [Lactobacillus sp. PV034]QNQ81083.1 glycosyltransferase family 8 protein [Lactobacillus sp. PV034]
MNILFCGDANAEDGVLITTLSLLQHVDELHLYILTMKTKNADKQFYPFSQHAVALIERLIKAKNPKSTVQLIDITQLYQKDAPKPNQNTRFTPYAMIRLFADEIPALPDRILYLDNDIIIRKDIDEFYNQDLHGIEFVGVLDFFGRWFFHNQWKFFDYINSGVLLLNLKYIKETGLFARVRNLMRTKKMFFPDQTALNKLAKHKKIAPQRFNEQRKLHKNTVIQHFTTSFRFIPYFHMLTVKPWDVERVHSVLHLHEYDDLLNEYLKLKPQLHAKRKD